MSREITDHLCCACGVGRIERIESAKGTVSYMCPNCDATVTGPAGIRDLYKDLCFCGHKFPNGKRSGLVCMKNPNRTPELPHAIIVGLDQA